MIPISLTTAMMVYSVALAVIFLVLHLYAEKGARRSQRILSQQYLWRCTYCGYSYLDEQAEAMSECPRCHSLNDETDGRPVELRTHPAPANAVPRAEQEEVRRNPSRRKRPTQRRRGPRKR